MSIFWAYVKFRIAVGVLRLVGRIFQWALLVAVLVAAAPVTLVAGIAFAGAWLRGWPPAATGPYSGRVTGYRSSTCN